jgi:hypothetical protein
MAFNPPWELMKSTVEESSRAMRSNIMLPEGVLMKKQRWPMPNFGVV